MGLLNDLLNFLSKKPSEPPTSKPPENKVTDGKTETKPQNPATIPGELKPGRVVNGILDDTRLLLYRITSAFEGAELGQVNYENLTGNFDGQGLSIGFLQWCTGQGSDFYLFETMLKKYPEKMKEAMGDLFEEFAKTMAWGKKDRLTWACSINTNKKSVKPEWAEAFKKLCQTKEFQSIQNLAAENIFTKAVEYCDRYGLKSVRALSLMFDIRVQNGSINEPTHNEILQEKKSKELKLKRALTEPEFLEIIAIKRAAASNPRWAEDVKKRKLAIVYGKGLVHGENYDFNKMGLSDAPFRVKNA